MQLNLVPFTLSAADKQYAPAARRRSLPALAVLALLQAPLALAQGNNDACYWRDAPGVLMIQRDLGTLYVPRDASIGTVIGHTPNEVLSWPVDRRRLQCWIGPSGPGRTLNYSSIPSVPIFSGTLPPVNGKDVNGKVLQTNIPGVGAHIQLGDPYAGRWLNSFYPIGDSVVPFDAEAYKIMLTPIEAGEHRATVTLIKTGPIAPGPQILDGSELFSGTFSDVGKGTSFGVTGTVIQAQCTVSGNPVSADPVKLGDWETSDFTGPGFTTTAVNFSIRLSACEADSSGATIATAHMKLQGKNGSAPINPAAGVFSLTSASTAQGVGIQILKADGVTPMELDIEVPLITLTPGDMTMHFHARFYQTQPTVRAGDAKGALDFTMTYK